MADSMQYYAEVLYERDRATFFDTVPNYKSNVQIEIDRIEAAHPQWIGSPAVAALQSAFHGDHPYGHKKGSPHSEE